jgi:protein-L-isoaspartate(D-aspartate) O-methyltransferase
MEYERQRAELVDRLCERESLSEATAEAMHAVPRHAFVPADSRDSAYRDSPLPIGQGQTISAPHMVAIMTELLSLSKGDRVLEIGTGCGYHAAVTAEVVGSENVYSVEYHDDLAVQARETLAETGYDEISVKTGDGKQGWADHAPYDRAYLTCAASDFPPAVVDQVRPGGILLGPIDGGRQELIRATVQEDGSLDRSSHGPVRFVPLQ